MKIPNDVTLKKPNEYTLIGKPMKRHPKEVEEKITGKAEFGIDIRLSDMKYAALIHPRTFGAKIKSFDASQAENLPGVLKIKKIPTQKIVVIAQHWWQAKKALEVINVEWDEGEFAKISTEDLKKEYQERLDREDNPIMRKDGNIEKAFNEGHL